MRKGRRGGLWMNVGEIVVHEAPSLYLVMSTSPGAAYGRAEPSATWGYPALKKRITFTGQIEAGRSGRSFWTSFSSSRKANRFTPPVPGPSK